MGLSRSAASCRLPHLKTPSGLALYQSICETWTNEPERFTVDPTHHILGLNHLGGVFIQVSQAIAQARDTNAQKDESVFSQRSAILRKRLILLKKNATKMALLAERPVDRLPGCPHRVPLDLCRCIKFIDDERPQVIGVIGRVRHDVADALRPSIRPRACGRSGAFAAPPGPPSPPAPI